MDVSIVTEYMSPLALIAALCVGYIVKNLVPNEEVNRYIPLIAAVVGLAFCIAEGLASGGGITPQTVVEGLVSGLASTGLYEASAILSETTRRLNNGGSRGNPGGIEGHAVE